MPIKLISPKNSKSAIGFADISIFAKYQLYKKDAHAKTFRILARLIQSLPTGKTGSNPHIGSGLSQTYIGLVIGQINTRVGVYSDFGYNFTNKNASDNFRYNFSIGLPVLAHKYPQNQLNTFIEYNGDYVFDSDSHTLFVSPGLQYIHGKRLLFETSFQIPIVQQNIATNKTDYMVLFGTRYLMN